MSAMGKILIDPVNGKAISDIDGQFDRDDVANNVFLREIDVSAVPLLKTSYLSWSRISNVQTFNSVSKSVQEVFDLEYCRGQRASADISCVLPC